eukprot:9500108-Karenia_brevis.AAC.1
MAAGGSGHIGANAPKVERGYKGKGKGGGFQSGYKGKGKGGSFQSGYQSGYKGNSLGKNGPS